MWDSMISWNDNKLSEIKDMETFSFENMFFKSHLPILRPITLYEKILDISPR